MWGYNLELFLLVKEYISTLLWNYLYNCSYHICWKMLLNTWKKNISSFPRIIRRVENNSAVNKCRSVIYNNCEAKKEIPYVFQINPILEAHIDLNINIFLVFCKFFWQQKTRNGEIAISNLFYSSKNIIIPLNIAHISRSIKIPWYGLKCMNTTNYLMKCRKFSLAFFRHPDIFNLLYPKK